MNRLIVACVAILGAASATATDFAARVAAAKLAEQSQEGGEFLRVLGPAYGAAMRACILPGTSSPDNLGKFELVADVAADGRILNTDFRPATRVSRCFARELAAQSLAPPPKFRSLSTYPVYIAMEVAP
jgi:hypothetical protein